MLVYANSFVLSETVVVSDVIGLIAKWAGQPRKTFVDPERLGRGVREFRFADGATLSSVVTADEEGSPIFPYHFCSRLVHGQPGVPGRRWTTEIGLRRPTPDDRIECSVLLRTDEISTRVTTPIQATRPGIVTRILEHCTPDTLTPGLSVKHLSQENASLLLDEVWSLERRYPIVQISADQSGIYPVLPQRMQSVLVGLAQVFAIAPEVDTYALEAVLTRRFSAYGGAINLIFPVRRQEPGGFCKTVLFRPDEIRELAETGSAIDSDVLAAITHRTNIPHSWRHISSDIVNQAILRGRLDRAIGAARGSDDVAAYEILLQEAADQLSVKDDEIAEARIVIERGEESLDDLRSENEGLKHALSGVQARPDAEKDQLETKMASLREKMRLVLGNNASLEQILRLFSELHPNRLLVLDSAFMAARESDRGGFRQGKKAFELLMKFSEDYYDALLEGKGDQFAKSAFGTGSFAAKEASTLSNEGKDRRTFSYGGSNILMEKHLKHGIKDSLADTLRIHFEWFPSEKLLVIGHCGKHLNF